jgi:hypothetical protein
MTARTLGWVILFALIGTVVCPSGNQASDESKSIWLAGILPPEKAGPSGVYDRRDDPSACGWPSRTKFIHYQGKTLGLAESQRGRYLNDEGKTYLLEQVSAGTYTIRANDIVLAECHTTEYPTGAEWNCASRDMPFVSVRVLQVKGFESCKLSVSGINYQLLLEGNTVKVNIAPERDGGTVGTVSVMETRVVAKDIKQQEIASAEPLYQSQATFSSLREPLAPFLLGGLDQDRRAALVLLLSGVPLDAPKECPARTEASHIDDGRGDVDRWSMRDCKELRNDQNDVGD